MAVRQPDREDRPDDAAEEQDLDDAVAGGEPFRRGVDQRVARDCRKHEDHRPDGRGRRGPFARACGHEFAARRAIVSRRTT
jgi:hypothetical protein